MEARHGLDRYVLRWPTYLYVFARRGITEAMQYSDIVAPIGSS